VFDVLGFDYGENGTEYFGLKEGVVNLKISDDGGFDKAVSRVKFAAKKNFALCRGEEGLDTGELGGVDNMAD
jgi:hypothetical protein